MRRWSVRLRPCVLAVLKHSKLAAAVPVLAAFAMSDDNRLVAHAWPIAGQLRLAIWFDPDHRAHVLKPKRRARQRCSPQVSSLDLTEDEDPALGDACHMPG